MRSHEEDVDQEASRWSPGASLRLHSSPITRRFVPSEWSIQPLGRRAGFYIDTARRKSDGVSVNVDRP